MTCCIKLTGVLAVDVDSWTCPVLMTTAMTCCIKLTGVLAVDVDSWTLRRSCLISSWSIRPCATPTAENQFDNLSPLNSPPHKLARGNSFSPRLLVLFCSTDRKGIHHLTLAAGVLVKVALEAIQDGTSESEGLFFVDHGH